MENTFKYILSSEEGLILFSSIIIFSYLTLLTIKAEDHNIKIIFQTESKIKFTIFFILPIFIFIYFIILKIEFINFYMNLILFILNIFMIFIFICYLTLFLYLFYYFLTRK